MRIARCPVASMVRQQGLTLTELLVALLVGLVATVVILQTFALAEGRKRMTTGLAEAQQTGTIALFTLAREIANAGQAMAAAANELDTCPDTGDVRTTQRPVAVLITTGGNANTPDSFVINHGAAALHGGSVPFAAEAAPLSNYRVHTAFGVATDDRIVAISRAGQCAASIVATVSAADADGVVEIAHSGAPDPYPASAVLLDLGQRSNVARTRYDIADATLRSLDLLTAGATPNPLASNIVNLKLQYGIDSDNDGFADTWVSGASPGWQPASVLAAPLRTLLQVKAVRIGLVVRSDAYDRAQTRQYPWVLFDCAREDKTQCPGRLAGTLPAGWHYRTYETAIPLRNQIWNQ